MDVLTHNQLNKILKDIGNRHLNINTTLYSRDWELENNEDIIYPLFAFHPDAPSMPEEEGEYKVLLLSYRCTVVDRVKEGENNKEDVDSDTFQICQDIINELNQHPSYIRANATLFADFDFEYLDEFEDDFTNGWRFNLRIRVKNHNQYCFLPFTPIDGYTPVTPETPSVPEMLVNNSTVDAIDIITYQPGAGPKGTDMYEFEFTLNINTGDLDPNTLLLVSNFDNGFQINPTNYNVPGNFSVPTIGITSDFESQNFYFEQYYASPGGDSYTITTQLFNTVTGQYSDIKTFTIVLEPF